MDHTEPEATTGRISLVLATVFLLVVVGGLVDLVLDRPVNPWSLHVILEVVIVIVSLGGATYLARGWFDTRRRLLEVSRESQDRERERHEWQQRASALLAGLGKAVTAQFDRWRLTPAEKRVALMLLKGHSHKRIARMTSTSERTARQHSVAVYRKAGVAGRAELAGFFLAGLDPSEEPDSS